MNCPICGAAVTPSLSYCNRCGAELTAKEPRPAKPSEASPEYLMWAIVAVSVGGIGVMLALMALMKQALHFSTELIVLFSLLSFALLLGAEGIFIWMLIQSRSRASNSAGTAQLSGEAQRELGAAQARLLNEQPMSVTEHTTRTLEPVYRERKTD